jgi:uncharacterized protein YuzE
MYVEYDDEADAAFIWLIPRPDDGTFVVDGELWPAELGGKIGLLFDIEKKLVGLEVLGASSRLPKVVLDELAQ